jgi:hypothetical protein
MQDELTPRRSQLLNPKDPKPEAWVPVSTPLCALCVTSANLSFSICKRGTILALYMATSK